MWRNVINQAPTPADAKATDAGEEEPDGRDEDGIAIHRHLN